MSAKILVFLLAVSVYSTQTHAANFECTNSQALASSFLLTTLSSSWVIEDTFGVKCSLEQQGEPLENSNYKNWIKLVPNQDENQKCKQLEGLFDFKAREIHHILISTEIQNNEKGFAQFKYQSSGQEYGPKTIKTFVKCLPTQSN